MPEAFLTDGGTDERGTTASVSGRSQPCHEKCHIETDALKTDRECGLTHIAVPWTFSTICDSHRSRYSSNWIENNHQGRNTDISSVTAMLLTVHGETPQS